MLRKKIGFIIFMLGAGLIFIYAPVQAEAPSRAQVMDGALIAKAYADEGVKAADAKDKALNPQKPDYREELREPITEGPVEGKKPFDFSSLNIYSPKTNAKTGGGGVSTYVNESEVNYEYKIIGKFPLEFSFGSTYVNLNNSTPVFLPAYLTGIETGVNLTFPVPKLNKTYIRIGVSPSWYTDSWSTRSSAMRLPSNAFAIYQPNKKLTVLAGVAIFPHYKFRDLIVPFAGLIYMPNDKWLFNLIPENPNITYKLNSKVNIFCEYLGSDDEFLVKKGGMNDVALHYTDDRAGFGLTYKVNKYIEGSFSTGGTFSRSLKYRDSGKVGLKNGIYTALRLDISI